MTVALYASIGPRITRYTVNVEAAELTAMETVSVTENVQYVWPHVSGRYVYVASSNSASGLGPAGDSHHITAFTINPANGALTQHGQAIALPARPIHIATDIPSRHILAAFSNPGDFQVYRINPDARPGTEVQQSAPIDTGIYPHQVRATPDGKRVILVTRGHSAGKDTPEQPGALKVFDYNDGVLGHAVSVAPNGGYGFGPRHLDFHPSKPWVYVSLERQNALALFTLGVEGLASEPRFIKPTLATPAADTSGHRQLAGTVHVHPNGRVVYAVNRASATVIEQGRAVFAGGENTLVVYAIDPVSGEPTAIQHVDTRGIHCRTFHIDPSGRVLVAAHIMAMPMRDGSTTPANLSVFRIKPDGRLDYVRSYEVYVADKTMFWMGMIAF